MSGTCPSEYVNGLPSTIPPYHPEFGYLCPSPLVRRSARLALVSGAIGMLIGAVAILSLLDKRLAQTSASEQVSALAQGDQNDAGVDKLPISVDSSWLRRRRVVVGRLQNISALIFRSKLSVRKKAQAGRCTVDQWLGNREHPPQWFCWRCTRAGSCAY